MTLYTMHYRLYIVLAELLSQHAYPTCYPSQIRWQNSSWCLRALTGFSHKKNIFYFQAKKDDMLRYKLERVPFLEEQVRMIKETGRQLSGDIERLLLSEENKYAFVNEIAAEAKQYVDNNRDEYGAKKAIFHVISNRMNEAGYSRPEAYMEPDPYKPGPGYMRDELIVWELCILKGGNCCFNYFCSIMTVRATL